MRKPKNIQSTTTHIPNGWRRVRISDLCVQDRRIIEPGSDMAIQLPYLSLEHIESGTGRILRDVAVPSNGEGKSTTFAFDTRHVLYGKLRPYLNKVALPDFAGRCTTELIPLLPCENVSRKYLACLLRQPATVTAAMREKTGSRMPRENMFHVLARHVLIPQDLSLQDRVADELERRMCAIEKARKALKDQLDLLDLLAMRFLDDFPESISDIWPEEHNG